MRKGIKQVQVTPEELGTVLKGIIVEGLLNVSDLDIAKHKGREAMDKLKSARRERKRLERH